MVDKNNFFAELDAMGRNKVKDKVTQHAFRKKELSFVREWFLLENGRDFQTWVYHPLKDGKIVMFSEAINLYQKGWTDGPRKYPPGLHGVWYKVVLYFQPKRSAFNTFWINNREAMLVRIISGIALLFMAYLINKYIFNPTNQKHTLQELQSQQSNTKMNANPK